MSLRLRLSIPAVFTVLVLTSGPIPAADYPARPIRFVLGFAPGGASDTMARTVATRLSEGLGQPVVVDPRWARVIKESGARPE